MRGGAFGIFSGFNYLIYVESNVDTRPNSKREREGKSAVQKLLLQGSFYKFLQARNKRWLLKFPLKGLKANLMECSI